MMKKQQLFSLMLVASISLSTSAIKKFINIEYNDDTATLSIDRSKVSKIAFYEPEAVTVGDVSFNMVKVKAGTFTMGATAEQYNPESYEKPAHQVTLTKDYYMGETEVTQALWKAVMGNDNNPSGIKGDQLPVEMVSYNAITGENGFLAKLNTATGKTFRLPTEAEWEFAARGGNQSKKTQYSGSADIDEVAWYKNNSDNTTHKVATKKANELGLYDMSGNVAEWCSDRYGDYSSEAQTDPTGPTEGYHYVFRDGSFATTARTCRTAHRDGEGPTSAGGGIGFRLACTSLGAEADNAVKIKLEYNDGTAPVVIDRSKVKRITFTDADLIFKVGNVTFKMNKVERGSFKMGEEGIATPVHKVTFTKDYYIGVTEVTQGLWQEITGYNPSGYELQGDQMPVQNVSYGDITDEKGFLAKLNERTGKKFRLPTEAEWEFAARGGNESKGYKYSGSDTLDDVAWFDTWNNRPNEVAKKKANELGLYDMSGNVWEWCSDWYGDYSSEDQIDPTGYDPTGSTTRESRVRRGGSWLEDDEKCCRPSYREKNWPSYSNFHIGLRLCLSAE